MKRGYADGPYGQIHYHDAGAGRPLVLIHASPASSVRLVPLMKALAGTQPLYAPDTLGNGDSCKMTMAARGGPLGCAT